MLFKSLVFIGFIIICLLSFSKIQERFKAEVLVDNNQPYLLNGVHTVTIQEAFTKEKFSPNDFFPGTAFRIYQARLFFDFLKEEPIFWTGFGVNASGEKIKEKAIQYNVFQGNEKMPGYQTKNFHNQYIQNFAELGVVGFLLLIVMLVITLRNAIKTKDFIHFSFAVLMISLFLTESFLWRQRGVIFFTLFYCLFNAELYKNDSTKIE
jgi:O-antigen ligase